MQTDLKPVPFRLGEDCLLLAEAPRWASGLSKIINLLTHFFNMKYFFFLSILLLSFTACNKGDKCEGTSCGQYGAVTDDCGCDCPPYAYKINGVCDGLNADNFVGDFVTTSSFCDGSFPTGTTLSCSRSTINLISVQFGGANKIFELVGEVTQTSVSFTDQPSQGYRWSGSGSISGNLISLNLTRKDPGSGSPDCTFTIQGTK